MTGSLANILEFLAGFLVVLLVLSDIFRTILLPRPTHRALRITPLLGRLFVPIWLAATAHIKSLHARQTVRASLAPLLIVITTLIWVDSLLFGYGVMLHAAAADIQPAVSFGQAIYDAGSAFLTLGISEIKFGTLARMIIITAGLSGFAIVTILATFLLSVQQALQRREVLVLSTLTAAGRPPSGLTLLETYGKNDTKSALAALYQNWEHWCADILHSHRSDPILAHFRSADADGEWLAVLGAALDAAALLLATVQHETNDASAARLLLPIGQRTVCALAQLFNVDLIGHPESPAGAYAFKLARRRLADAGYTLVEDEKAALERWRELRGKYWRELVALCDQLGVMLPDDPIEDAPESDPVPEKDGKVEARA